LLHLSRVALTRLQRHPAETHGSLVDEAEAIQDHVVIAGFGRVGQTLGVLLDVAYIRYVALDLDPELVAAARRHGHPVFFGDASRVEVLKAAGLERARIAVSTLDEPGIASRAVQVLRNFRPSLPILARGEDTDDCEKLVEAGATVAVPEVVEGSLQLGGVLLRQLGESAERVNQILEQVRQEAYARLAEITVLEPSGRIEQA
jgi:CPA2 family monovalent cation:H+ antiporter-2